jgi:protein-disulfide isomerase
MENMPQEEVVIIENESPKKPDRFLAISILIAAVLIGGAIVFSTLYKGGGAAQPAGAGAVAGGNGAGTVGAATTTVNSNAMVLGPRDAILGQTNAPVTIVEYGDYQCPFCTQFFSQTEPQIVSNYINAGSVRMIFRNFAFLGAESIAAAQAAECAFDQNKLWPYHDALYSAKIKDEQSGGSENDGYYKRSLFIQLAQQLGMDTTAFATCIDSGKYSALITKEKTDAGAVGVDSTPSFFVNGVPVVGAQPYSDFSATIDGFLKK